MISVSEFMAIVLYIIIVILLVMLIDLVYRAIQTIKKVNLIVDDINEKTAKLNNAFNLIDKTTGIVVGMGDRIASMISSKIENFVNRRRGKEDE